MKFEPLFKLFFQKKNTYSYLIHLGMVVLLFVFSTACSSVYQKAESEFDRAAYNKAITLYKEYLAKNSSKAAEVNYKIAEAYRRSNRIQMALPYYEKVQEAGTEILTDGDRDTIRYYKAEALKANKKYTKAKAQFEEYANVGINRKLKKLAQTEVENLETIAKIAEPQKYVTVVPCDGINSESSDFAPTKWLGKLIFSSDRRKENIYEGTGKGFYDLYSFESENDISDTTGACIGTIKLWGGEIFNKAGMHDASAAFSPDGNTVIFARSGNGDKRGESDKEVSLYTSTLKDGLWTDPEPLKYVNSSYWDGTPFITNDGKTLYFSSNRPSSKGGLDIYKASFNEVDKTWASVVRLGDDINTEGNEMFPYLDEKGRFFFASNGHGGLGGLDVFVQEEMKNPDDETQMIKKIRNVGSPINSAQDDFGLVFTEKDDKGGYFTSNRKENQMDTVQVPVETHDDIYRFHLDSLDIREVRYVLRGTVRGIDKVENTSGFLADVDLDLNLGNDNIVKVKTDKEGKFLFDTSLVIGKVYDIDVMAEGYLPKNDNAFSTVERGLDKSKLTQMYTTVYFDTAFILTKDFFVTTTDEGEKDMLPPEIEILYQLNSAALTPEAEAKLDNFVTFLKDYLNMYPEAQLIMGSHTDARGSNRYNQRLSQRRANSAVSYILKKGISKERIKAVGYGETRLKIPRAKNEEEHQLNRRTTVEVVK